MTAIGGDSRDTDDRPAAPAPVSGAAAVLQLEARALQAAADRLEPEVFSRAVELLVASSGKVVIFGVGTSGAVARKIAATLTSTGSPALFLHPSDALHGGLGVIGDDDVVIAVSNSGETEELLALVPYVQLRRLPLIAIVGNRNSRLGELADVVLDAFVDQEACTLGLAPTASTTVAVGLGDALAVSAQQARGSTREDFARSHPSGRLGRRLTLRVSDLMHAGGNHPTVRAEAGFLDLVRAVSAGGLGAANVVSEDGRLLGIVTDGDLRRALEAGVSFESLDAKSVMTATPAVVAPEALAYEALVLMEDRPSQIAVLPVVDDEGMSVGMVRLHDLVRAGL